jgi:probable HAF family extracellular repeat protein
VGYSLTAENTAQHAFSWTAAGGMVDLGTLGGTQSSAAGVNANGQVVGSSDLAGDTEQHVFSWTAAGGMVDLGAAPGFSNSYAVGINDHGQASGGSYNNSSFFPSFTPYTEHATLWNDTTPPTITITSPAANATYQLNASVGASYACVDSGSGVASCQGTVANGSPINTSSTGTKSFTVTATDNAGNPATLTVTYTVVSGGGGGATSADVGQRSADHVAKRRECRGRTRHRKPPLCWENVSDRFSATGSSCVGRQLRAERNRDRVRDPTVTRLETASKAVKNAPKAPQSRSRHGLNAVMARVTLRGFRAIDRRTSGAREVMAFRREVASALGGEEHLSPQRRKLVDMAARAALFLDHLDGWLTAQKSLVNHRTRSVLPALVQRQSIADHLARLLDKLGLDRVPQRLPTLTEYLARRREGDRPGTANAPEHVDTAVNGTSA